PHSHSHTHAYSDSNSDSYTYSSFTFTFTFSVFNAVTYTNVHTGSNARAVEHGFTISDADCALWLRRDLVLRLWRGIQRQPCKQRQLRQLRGNVASPGADALYQ